MKFLCSVFIVVLSFSQLLLSQVIVVNGVNGVLRLESGSTLVLNSTGLVNDGTFSNDLSSNIVFSGSLGIDISGSQRINLGKLDVNSSAGITLSSTLHVGGQLNLQQGILTVAGGDTLIIQSAGSIAGTGNTSYIVGSMAKVGNTDFVFPLGASNYLRTLAISNLSATDTFVINYTLSDPSSGGYNTESFQSPIVTVSSKEYWLLSALGGAGADIILSWNGNTSGAIAQASEMLVATWDGSKWISAGGTSITGDATAGTVTTSAPLSLSSSVLPISLASSSPLNVLPVSLVSFYAKSKEEGALISWQTASEYKNHYFSLEKSGDGNNYHLIATIPGVGTSQVLQTYQFLDLFPEIKAYYRLSQTDYDGKTTYYDPIVLFNTVDDLLSIKQYNGNLVICLDKSISEDVECYLYDIYGRKINIGLVQNNEKGKIELKNLSPNIYILRIESLKFHYKEKIIIK